MSGELSQFYNAGREGGEALAQSEGYQAPAAGAEQHNLKEEELADAAAWLQAQGVGGNQKALALLIGMVHGVNHPPQNPTAEH